jgi:hypothetical protein
MDRLHRFVGDLQLKVFPVELGLQFMYQSEVAVTDMDPNHGGRNWDRRRLGFEENRDRIERFLVPDQIGRLIVGGPSQSVKATTFREEQAPSLGEQSASPNFFSFFERVRVLKPSVKLEAIISGDDLPFDKVQHWGR